MKSLILFSIKTFLILFTVQLFGQCGVSDIFPVKFSMSKFGAINALNLSGYVYEVEEQMSYWRHHDYLPDSTYYTQIGFQYKMHPCLKGDKVLGFLFFSDNKVYKMTIDVYFKPENFNKCMDNYKLIFNSLKKTFPFISNFTFTSDLTHEQTGEGHHLYKTQASYNNTPIEGKHYKVDEMEIGYYIEYESEYVPSKGRVSTGKIENYLLEIEYVNLNGTKLDNRGY